MSNIITILGQKRSGASVSHIPYSSFFISDGKLKSVDFLDGVLKDRFVDPRFFSLYRFEGAWMVRNKQWLSETGEVLDQRSYLGTPRPAQPLRATELNGTNQYGWIPIDPVTAFPFTVFGWARCFSGSIATLVGISSSSATNQYMSFRIDGQIRTGVVRRNTTEHINGTTALANIGDVWASYLCVFTSETEAKIYRNGVLVLDLTGMSSVALGTGLNRFHIGALRAASPAEYLASRLMHCGFLRRAATLADAQAFHTTGIIPDAEVLLPLDDNSTAVAHNIGSSAAHWLDEPRRNLLQYTEAINAGNGWTISGTGVETDYPGEGRGLNVSRSVAGAGFGISAVRTVALTGATAGIVHTYQIRVRRVSGPTTVTIRGIESGGATADEGSDSGSFTLNSEFQTITFSRTVVRNDRTGVRFFIQTTGAGDYVVDTVLPQLELGSTATPYQPVFRTGIDYPEATIVNGAAGMLYTGRDVPFSRQNKVGFSTRRNLITFTEDASNAAWSFVNVSGTATRVGNNITFGSSAIDRILSSTLTIAANTQMTASFTLSGSGQVRLFLIDGTGLTQSPGNITLTSTPTRYTATFTLVNAGSQARCAVYNDSSGLPATFTIHNAQLELGPTATPYQRISANPGANVLIPALLSDPTKSAATDPLTFSGEVPRNAQLEQANCFTFDGSDDRVAVDLSQWAGPELVTNGTFDSGIAGWTSVNSSILTWNTGKIHVERTAGAGDRANQQISTTAGRSYLLSLVSKRVSGVGDATLRIGTLPAGTQILNTTNTSSGTTESSYTTIFIAASGESNISLGGSGNGVYEFDSVSVRELPSTIRPNVVENGTFDSSASWTLGTGWAIGSGVATKTAGTASVMSQVEPFVIGRKYLLTYTLTRSAGTITPRFTGGTTVNGAARSGSGTFSEVLTALTGNTTLEFSADSAFAGTVDNVTLQEIVEIQNDGTSLLTYRPEGDGFTGTAGTAYNIRIGDVEHIPCSEGHGSVLHGTKLNQAYTVVNGQFSNWTANKQNTYHYNTAEGYGLEEGDVPTIDPLDLPGLKVYLDFEDTTRMWRDAAGTIPVTAPGQEILRITDKSDQVTFVQNTPGQGPVWGRHPVSGIRNLLSFTNQFDDSYWVKSNSSVVANVDANPVNGQMTADRMTTSAANGEVRPSFSYPSTGIYTLTVYAKTETLPQLILRLDRNTNTANVTFTFATEAVAATGANIISGSATNLGNGWYRLRATANVVNAGFVVGYTAGAATGSVLLWGGQLEAGSVATELQTVTNRFDITEVGQPDLYYLSGNGTNQRMASLNPVDFSTTDKVTVWAGLRKLSDVNRAMLVELGVGNLNQFHVESPTLSSNGYTFDSRGSAIRNVTLAGFPAPNTASLIGEGNIGSDLCRLTVNGTTSTNANDQGTGNYSNLTLHLFSRGGSSLFFNGFCYGLVIGADNYVSSTVTEIDKLMRSKSGLVWYKDTYIPASQTNPGFDVLGNPLTNPPVVGLNGAESRINFSPVANSWPTGISIPGADIPTYEFDGNAGDINIGINNASKESKFTLERE